MIENIQKMSVKALFKKDDRILLVKDPKGIWELPGGRIEHGENPEEALKRELAEELGWIKVTVKEIIDSWSFTSENNKHFIILVYKCAIDEDEIKKNDEYTEYKWIPISEIDSLEMRDGYKKAIKKLSPESILK